MCELHDDHIVDSLYRTRERINGHIVRRALRFKTRNLIGPGKGEVAAEIAAHDELGVVGRAQLQAWQAQGRVGKVPVNVIAEPRRSPSAKPGVSVTRVSSVV